MRRKSALGCVVLSMIFAASCARPPLAPTISYNAAAHPVKSIVLLTPFAPRGPSLVSPPPVAAAPLMLFGAVGGIAAGLAEKSLAKAQQDHFDALLDKDNFQPRQILIDAVTQRLQAKGYKVSYVEATRQDPDFLASYPFEAPAGCDSYLDVVLLDVGYLSPSQGALYQPVVEVKFKYASLHDEKTLAEGSFGYSSAKGDTPPPLWFSYGGYSDFAGNQTTAIDGMTEGLNDAADKIADGLN